MIFYKMDFVNSKKENRVLESFFWNMLGGLINAGQSVYFSIIITRVSGLYWAGIFSLAYSTAIMCLSIGNYSMRNYQVTDIQKMFTFKEYLFSRYITCAFMFISCVIFLIYKEVTIGYSADKIICIILMCLFKIVDSLEDVFHGLYQKKGRLDIAGKQQTYRLISAIIVFTIIFIASKSLIIALSGMFVTALLLFLWYTHITFPFFKDNKEQLSPKKILVLLKFCFPLFISSFLILYIGNASKYAIDLYYDESIQAYYSFIAMPIFVIGMINNFLYQPLLTSLADEWNRKKIKRFIKKVILQIVVIIFFTCLVIIVAFYFGTPILSVLYGVELDKYTIDLCILLVGGGFLAIAGFLTVILTIMRMQKSIMYSYLVVSVIAIAISGAIVRCYAIRGATLSYLFLMFFLSIILMFICFRKSKESSYQS